MIQAAITAMVEDMASQLCPTGADDALQVEAAIYETLAESCALKARIARGFSAPSSEPKRAHPVEPDSPYTQLNENRQRAVRGLLASVGARA